MTKMMFHTFINGRQLLKSRAHSNLSLKRWGTDSFKTGPGLELIKLLQKNIALSFYPKSFLGLIRGRFAGLLREMLHELIKAVRTLSKTRNLIKFIPKNLKK